jgi:hypothetical protein
MPYGGASGLQGAWSTSDAYRNGDEIRLKYGLEDPAHITENEFIFLVRSRIALPRLHIISHAIENKEALPELQHVVLEFWTPSWSFAIQRVPHREPEDQQYHFGLKIRARLIQYDDQSWFHQSTVLWQRTCKVYPEDLGMQWPTYKELQMNEGWLIKDILQKAGVHCAQEFTKTFVPTTMP